MKNREGAFKWTEPWRQINSSPVKSFKYKSKCLSIGLLQKQLRLEVKKVLLPHKSDQFRSQLWTKSTPPLPKYKKTHSSSLLCMIHSPFLVLQFPLLLVDMKSLRTNTEVGIIVQKFSSMCIKEQQQHADASCVWSLVLLTREQSREEKLCPSLHILLQYGYHLSFSVGQQNSKNNKKTDNIWKMLRVKGHRSF